MRRAIEAFLTVAALAVAGAAAATADESPPTVRIPRVSRPPALDDFVRGKPREAGIQISDFRQYEPDDGTPASFATSAFLSYDDDHLHVVFVCAQDSGGMRAHLAKREEIDEDDIVVVNLDTFGDRRRAYSFFVNPLGIQKDAIWTEGQGSDASWDAVWFSDGRATESGYAVVMSIPFRILRYPSRAEQEWGVELGRVIRHRNEMSTWPRTTQRIESFVQQFATLKGIEGISRARSLVIGPNVVAARARSLDDPPRALRSDSSAEAGVDAKVVLRDSLILDITLNPDFSQVETDEPQVTINQRFEVFFPEKRPFFTENAGYFQTPINLFFSRRIVEPEVGLRLTGRAGPWSIGAVAIDDRSPPREESASAGSEAAIGVLRLQRDFHGQSTVGLLVTDSGASARNRLFSIDSRVKAGPNWVATLQVARSEDQPPGGASASGLAALGEIAYAARNLSLATRFKEISPDFRSDLGYIPRTDVRTAEQYLRYYWKPAGRRVLLFGPDATLTWTWDHEGRLAERVVDLSAGADLRGPTGMGCRHVEVLERFEERLFRRRNTDCGANVTSSRWLQWTADVARGTAVVYRPAPPLAPFVAETTTAKLGLTFRPTPRLRLSPTYIRTEARAGTDPVPSPADDFVFRNDLGRVTFNFQFTRPLSLRVILDYDAVRPNPAVIALERTERLTGDVLLTWMLHPGTAIYLGYTNRRENLSLSGTGEGAARTSGLELSTARQLFFKITYLFQM